MHLNYSIIVVGISRIIDRRKKVSGESYIIGLFNLIKLYKLKRTQFNILCLEKVIVEAMASYNKMHTIAIMELKGKHKKIHAIVIIQLKERLVQEGVEITC